MQSFKTKSDVINYLADLEAEGLLFRHSNGWSATSAFCRYHDGEYSQPDYRPVLYKDWWGICKFSFYRDGAPNALSPKRVNLAAQGIVDLTWYYANHM